MSLQPGRTLLNYRLVEKIGEGGMGEVWKAADTTLDREVAVKLLPAAVAGDPDRMARFEREAKLLAALSHPHIAGIYGLHEDGGHRFLAMELVHGEDLSRRLSRGPLPVPEAVALAAQIAEALAAAHERGVVHRDLKPANVMVTHEGSVKVLDFGLAKMAEPVRDGSSADASRSPTITAMGTQAGVILGTAAYMSPEQARGQAVDERADIWALGATLYEMLTGDKPFHGETVSDTLAAVLRAEVDFDALPPDTPGPVRRALRRCLERDPRRRLRDAGEVRFALVEEEEDIASGTAPATARSRRGWALAAALVLVAAVLGAWAGASLWQEAPRTREVVRAVIPPPPGSRFFLTTRQPGPVAISRDGRSLTYVTLDSERKVRLWVHPLADETPRPLPGTEGASYPFWSPDGRSIAFFADRKLKRIELEGGAVLTVCDAPFGKGGSWNEAGQIVFAPTYNSEIHLVSANGGTSRPITRFPEAAPGETLSGTSGNLIFNSHRFPQFLPDGERFLFLARAAAASDAEGNTVYIAPVAGGEAREVTLSDAQAQVAAGRLLYLRDGVLLSRVFDPDTLEFASEPVPLARDLTIIRGADRGVYAAADNGILVTMRGTAREGQLLAWVDRTGKRVDTIETDVFMDGVSISPDGTLVAADIDGSIWVFDPRRGTRRRITFGEMSGEAPVWTPDGRHLIYRAPGAAGIDLFMRAADGSGDTRTLVARPGDQEALDVSPDGRTLLFQESGEDGTLNLWTLDLAGDAEAQPWMVVPYMAEDARFSPDGRFVTYRADETGRDEVFITSFPDQSAKLQVSTVGGVAPRWSDDGSELFFLSQLDAVWSAAIRETGQGLEVGRVEHLFDLTVPTYENYDVHGGRFLVESEGTGAASATIHLVVNWPAIGE